VISIVHEFTHCASMRVQANIANNPRWLWETVALYEAGQFVDPMTLPLLNGAAPPTLQQLNSLDNTMIYSIGASLGRFIVQTWGADAFRALIRSNGNTAITLGLADSDLIDRWFQHAKNSLSE
jgi:hypothetical protein